MCYPPYSYPLDTDSITKSSRPAAGQQDPSSPKRRSEHVRLGGTAALLGKSGHPAVGQDIGQDEGGEEMPAGSGPSTPDS
jgi:hypothetical protein